MARKLAEKTAVITGGSSGIGLATANRFVNEGAYIFITGRRKSELDAAVKQIGRNVTGVQAMSPSRRTSTSCTRPSRSRKASSTSFLPMPASASLLRLAGLPRINLTNSST